MTKKSRIEVYKTILETGIVPVFYHADIDTAKQVVSACYEGGIRAFEFTNRGDFAHEVFTELVKWGEQNTPKMVFGVGSIVDAPTASYYLQIGASFIVGPLLNPDIFKVCNRRQVAYIPGCATASEIGLAQELGAEIVKIFPGGTVGGSSFVKNIKAPMPWTKFMVTGGVAPTKESLRSWFEAGVSAVGMGSKLIPKKEIEAKNWKGIKNLCSQSLSMVKEN